MLILGICWYHINPWKPNFLLGIGIVVNIWFNTSQNVKPLYEKSHCGRKLWQNRLSSLKNRMYNRNISIVNNSNIFKVSIYYVLMNSIAVSKQTHIIDKTLTKIKPRIRERKSCKFHFQCIIKIKTMAFNYPTIHLD